MMMSDRRYNADGYVLIMVGGKQVREHRFVWEQAYGPIPPGVEIDHINGVRDDNRIENLRLVTHAQNNRNSAPLELRSYPSGIDIVETQPGSMSMRYRWYEGGKFKTTCLSLNKWGLDGAFRILEAERRHTLQRLGYSGRHIFAWHHATGWWPDDWIPEDWSLAA